MKSQMTLHAPRQGALASSHMDAMRGIAALLVFLSHWRMLFFNDYPQVVSKSFVLSIFYTLTHFGHQAVVIFFVLSGYLVGGSALRMMARGWSWKLYLLNRISRLWMVLIPALLFGLAWDLLGVHLWGNGELYLGHLTNTLSSSIASHLGWRVALGNLFFLQGILVPCFGSNGPMWSLTNEFWYYILFPLLLLATQKGQARIRRSLCFCLLLGIAVFVGKNILLYFLIWLMGASLNYAPKWRSRNHLLHSFLLVASTLSVFSCATVAIVYSKSPFLFDLMIGIACTTLLWLVLQLADQPANKLYFKMTHQMAAMSYTLYLCHFPLTAFLAGWNHPNERWQPNARSLFISFMACGLVLLYSALIYQCFEKQTDKVRVWLKSHIPSLA